jgi:hypothetical protein
MHLPFLLPLFFLPFFTTAYIPVCIPKGLQDLDLDLDTENYWVINSIIIVANCEAVIYWVDEDTGRVNGPLEYPQQHHSHRWCEESEGKRGKNGARENERDGEVDRVYFNS